MSESDKQYDDVTVEHGDAARRLETATRRCPEISWTDGAGPHRVVIDGPRVAGSASGADVVIADRTVSRLHAEFDPRPDGLWVRDLGSRNGTFIEGTQVGLARVPEGRAVRLGGATVTLASAAASAQVTLWSDATFGALHGQSLAMRQLFARLARVAATDATVLIQGETGTGKELIARALHDASPRHARPFVIVDCAGMPEGLLEAELFGHAKGAFTGAAGARAGAFEDADGGTVFLDEVGELPLAMQPKLLRVLESRTVRRVGETAHRKVDVRFVSATHRDLRTMVNQGAFREDLYFRLAVLPIVVPPLRARTEDIPLLVRHFVGARASDEITPGLLADAAARPWLGNVRELRNFVERVLALGEHAALEGAPAEAPSGPPSLLAPVAATQTFKAAREAVLEHFEREYVRQILAAHGGNVAAAARAADVDKTYIYRLIRKHEA